MMKSLSIRCYAELNDFLPRDKRYRTFREDHPMARSLKDLVESLGIPHTEVDLVLVDGEPASFSTPIAGGERISLYPRFHRLPVEEVSLVRPPALTHHHFLLDVHLGKLASLLRMVGCDALYHLEASDAWLSEASAKDQRILLTRDRGLLKRSVVSYGYLVRSEDPDEQLIEVLRHFELLDQMKPFTRCMDCNGLLLSVPKEPIEDRLPPHVRTTQNVFFQCSDCGKLYWRGTHHEKMLARIEGIRARISDSEHSNEDDPSVL